MNVSQLMTRDVASCRPHDSLEDAAGKMWDRDVGCLPVLDAEGHLAGIITDRDVCMAAYTQGQPLRSIPVDSAMAHRVYACLPGDRVSDVEALMKEHRVRRVPVIDGEGHLVGLVAMNDIARATARELKKKAPRMAPAELVSTLASICEPRKPGALETAAE